MVSLLTQRNKYVKVLVEGFIMGAMDSRRYDLAIAPTYVEWVILKGTYEIGDFCAIFAGDILVLSASLTVCCQAKRLI